jgi:hypothetical protein
MILFTAFFATWCLLFKALLAVLGIVMAVMMFLALVTAFCASAIKGFVESHEPGIARV